MLEKFNANVSQESLPSITKVFGKKSQSIMSTQEF